MRRYFARRPLRRRIVALAAAYAIALSGLIASFGVANEAAAAAGLPGAICHTAPDGQQAPSPAGNSGKVCLDCCTGCAMHVAALPPPPASAAPLAQIAARRLAPPPVASLGSRPETGSHRSRAPPVTA